MDYTVHGILQARMLEWVAFPFSKGSSQPRNQAGVSCIAARLFTNWALREAQNLLAKQIAFSSQIYEILTKDRRKKKEGNGPWYVS